MARQRRSLEERFHSLLVRGFGLTECDFSHACVERVMRALNAARLGPPLEPVVLWLSAPTAFTTPGRHIYISRRLIERCGSDAPAALALAHEIAHHDLGHLTGVARWTEAVGGLGGMRGVALLVQGWVGKLYSPENERAADAYALDLCQRAGFDGTECLRLFDILRAYLIDHHDADGVYQTVDELGLDPALAETPIDWLSIEGRLWLSRHARSHPTLSERRAALRERLRKN